MHRNRPVFFILTLVIIPIGLFSRSGIIDRNSFLGTYSGDTLWATMVYLVFATCFAKSRIRTIAILSGIFSISIELSQLLKFDWLVTLRSYKLGGLILGYGFLWSDLLCYVMGIALGAGIDSIIHTLKKNNPPKSASPNKHIR